MLISFSFQHAFFLSYKQSVSNISDDEKERYPFGGCRSAAVLDEYISFNTSAFFIAQLIIFSPVPVSCDADVHSTDPPFEFVRISEMLGLG